MQYGFTGQKIFIIGIGKNKAVVIDSMNCTWSKGAIGMPSVIKVGNKLALLYDAFEGFNNWHMKRNIGLAWISLPIKISEQNKYSIAVIK